MKIWTLWTLLGSFIFTGCATVSKTEYVYEKSPGTQTKGTLVVCDTPMDESESIESRFGSSYEYAVVTKESEDCLNCLQSETIIQVADGKVIRREFTVFRMIDVNDAPQAREITSHWIEDQTQIGTHTEGFLPKTIEEVTSSCPKPAEEHETTAAL